MMQTCVTGAIALDPTGNSQGEYYFMSLSTGRCLNCQQFIPLPLPSEVINGVQKLACCNPSGLNMQDHNRRPFLDVSEDDDNDNSKYNKTDNEGNKIYDSDNDPPPVHNAMPVSARVITTDFRNRKWNSGLHDNNARDNEEDGRSAENEEEESITSSKNKINNQNNPENNP